MPGKSAVAGSCTSTTPPTARIARTPMLPSLPLPLTTYNVGSVESVGVVIFLAGQKRYACPGTRFLVHPLHWGFGSLVAADHSRVSEWRDCLDFDAERYASIFDSATANGPQPQDIRSNLCGNARLFTADLSSPFLGRVLRGVGHPN